MAVNLNTTMGAAPFYIVGPDGNQVSLGGTGATSQQVQGNVASGAADVGNPLKVGGEYLSTAPTFATGQRTDLQTSANGSVFVDLGRASNNRSPSSDALGAATGLNTYSQNMISNGATWDRIRDATSANATAGTGLLGAGVLGRYTTANPTYTTGQYGALRMSANGTLLSQISDGVNTATITGAGTDSVPLQSIPGLLTISVGYLWNGASFDRVRGDTTGTWTHAPANTVSTALSGTIATSGATATVAFINTARQEVINPSASVLWASWGTPAVNGAGSFQIAPGGSYSTDRTVGTLTLLATAATQGFTVNRFA